MIKFVWTGKNLNEIALKLSKYALMSVTPTGNLFLTTDDEYFVIKKGQIIRFDGKKFSIEDKK